MASPRPDPRPEVLPPHPDWLLHHLGVSGPADEIARFRRAAAGSGAIPWQPDHARLEEDAFLHLMASPARERRGIGAAGARLMAERLREIVQRRQERAIAEAGHLRSCPFDLHALLPVPVSVLVLGSGDPVARAWLWENWGTSQALRHVAALGGADAQAGSDSGGAALRVRFWSADWTPWRAIERLGTTWSGLRFVVRPIYDP